MTGTLTRRLIWHAAIDPDTPTEQRRNQLRLALRRNPTEADWQACKTIRDAHTERRQADVDRHITNLTDTIKED